MTVRLNVNITEKLNDRLDELAQLSGSSKSDLLRKAIALMDLAVTEKNRNNHLSVTNSDGKVLREIVGV
jgi:metal-responsive CopG/Arc/MetJ family transcriptional regulator